MKTIKQLDSETEREKGWKKKQLKFAWQTANTVNKEEADKRGRKK